MIRQDHIPFAADGAHLKAAVTRHPITRSKLLVVVDRREFSRGCLTFWLSTFAETFEVASVAEVDKSLHADDLVRVGAVIFSASAPILTDAWLQAQIAWLRANRKDVPIVMIAEADEAYTAEMLVGRRRLKGYIPTCSSMEVAAAALKLIVAGGIYVPRVSDEDRAPEPLAPEPLAPEPLELDRMLPAPGAAHAAKLTPRERAVLELLEHGLANKIIAHRLSMSQSTVKAHVHNIIAKLRVRNRTEAAVAARKSLSN